MTEIKDRKAYFVVEAKMRSIIESTGENVVISVDRYKAVLGIDVLFVSRHSPSPHYKRCPRFLAYLYRAVTI